MSEVKRFDVPSMRSLQGEQAVMGYEVVLASDYDALAAEAQALREEIKKAQNALAFTEQWYGVRHERLWHWAHAELNEEQKRRYFNIVANGTAEHSEPPTSRSSFAERNIGMNVQSRKSRHCAQGWWLRLPYAM